MNSRKMQNKGGAALAALILCAAVCTPQVHAQAIMEPADKIVYSEEELLGASYSQTELPEAASFAVRIPSDFVADKVPGRFICKRYPLDSAQITVENITLADDTLYTNEEKRERLADGETIQTKRRAYTGLTAAIFESRANAALEEGLSLKVVSFEKTSVRRASDGTAFPGFRIRAEIKGGKKPIMEEVYIYLSDDRIFTVSYAQASDDEFDDAFAESAASIAVY